MIKSRVKIKKYFLPVYLIWAFVIPTLLTLSRAYLDADTSGNFGEDWTNIWDAILWERVGSYYALFGLAYPLTIVVFYGFFVSYTRGEGFTLGEAISEMIAGGENAEAATKVVIAMIMFTPMWLGPLLHLILAFIFHRRYIISTQKHDDDPDKPITWSDYFFGFI